MMMDGARADGERVGEGFYNSLELLSRNTSLALRSKIGMVALIVAGFVMKFIFPSLAAPLWACAWTSLITPIAVELITSYVDTADFKREILSLNESYGDYFSVALAIAAVAGVFSQSFAVVAAATLGFANGCLIATGKKFTTIMP